MAASDRALGDGLTRAGYVELAGVVTSTYRICAKTSHKHLSRLCTPGHSKFSFSHSFLLFFDGWSRYS